MKISFMKDQILESLQTVQSVVSTRVTIPVLANVMLKTEGNRLELTTTDLEIGLRCSIEADIMEEGTVTLPARKLFSIVRELPSGRIDMSIDEKYVAHITSGSSFFKVIGLSSEDFPFISIPESSVAFTLEQVQLKELLQRTYYSASADETRQILNGVLLSIKEDKITAVGTDGRRLALAEQELECPEECATDVVLPMKTVNALLHTLGGSEKIKFRLATKQASFEYGHVMLVSNLLEGTYPNFRQVIPPQCEHRITLERELLLDAMKRVSLLNPDRSTSIRLTFDDNSMVLRAISPDVGEARETLAVKYDADPLNIAFNPEYLMDPLRNLNTDEISIELIDKISPGVIKSTVPFLYVLMPVRVQENLTEDNQEP